MTLFELYREKGEIIQDSDTKALFWPKNWYTWSPAEDVPVREEEIILLKGREIVLPPQISGERWKRWWHNFGHSDVRRPYYLLRGKPVTREQAFEMCYWWNNNTDWYHPWRIVMTYDILDISGNVGVNGLLGKNLERCAVIETLFELVEKFPFLEFSIAIMNHEEIPNGMWDAPLEEEHYTFEYPMGAEDVDYGVHVTKERIEVLEPDKAMACLQRYESFYTPEEVKRFDWNWNGKYYAETEEGQQELRSFQNYCAERERHTGSQREQDDIDT